MKTHGLKVIVSLVLTTMSYGSAYAKSDGPTDLTCQDGQSLWVYEIGDRGTTPPPEADGGTQSLRFEDWNTAEGSFWTSSLSGLPAQVTAAKTLERLRIGEESSGTIPLGEFFAVSPLTQPLSTPQTVAPTSTPDATSFNLEISASALFTDPNYNGGLTYVANADAQIQYVRLSLCSDAPAPVTTPVIVTLPTGGTSDEERIAELEAENQRLKSDVTVGEDLLDERDDVINTLRQETLVNDAKIKSLETLKTEISKQVEAKNPTNPELVAEVKSLKDQLNLIPDDVTAIAAESARLKSQNRTWQIVAGILGLIAAGLLGLMLFLRPSNLAKKLQTDKIERDSSNQKRPERALPAGVVFLDSPMQAANVVTPLSPAGQLTASNLQMLTGQFEVLRPAYHATGRIGFAQEGVPTSEDYSFGTGFLITPNHVMTNRHVDGYYGHYLAGDGCGGIEFIAEKEKDASDFIPFNGQPPLLIPGLDLAIFTLSRAAGNRPPLARIAIPTEDLDGRDIAVIGYPDTHEPNNPDILAVVEDEPIFAVKRISQGKIFRHSTDTDTPYGVNVNVDEDDKNRFDMPAICHNASTLGGNSGSPILDIQTGQLLGVHFAGYKVFNKEEAANLAMAIAQLTKNKTVNEIN